MGSTELILCAVTVAALDICALVLLICAYTDKSANKKYWRHFTGDMELAEQGRAYPLGCDEVIIGRHASADIRIPDLSVSRYHALMTINGGVWTITDIGSKSGVYINGNLVKEAILRENDVINIGSHRMVFRKRRDKKNV